MLTSLSPDQIDRVLIEAPFARLGCHADGKTYVVPVSFAFAGDVLVGVTTLGMKIEMMRKNPEVCVRADVIKDLTAWRSVVVWGRYEELDGIDAANAMGLLIDKYGELFEEMHTNARRGREMTPPRLDRREVAPVVYQITVTEKTGRAELVNGNGSPGLPRRSKPTH